MIKARITLPGGEKVTKEFADKAELIRFLTAEGAKLVKALNKN